MTELTNISAPADLVYPQQEESPPLLSLLTVPFIIGVVAVSPLDNWNYIVKALGMLLAITYFARALSSRVRVSAEFLLYMAWIAWGLTGAFVAVYLPVFWGTLGTLTQILVMLFIVSGATYLRKTLTLNLIAFLVGTVVVAVYSLVTGEYERPDDPEGRMVGLALNSNAFGFLMVSAMMVLAYLWMLPHHHPWLWYILIALAMAGAAISTVLSGSRTAISSMGVFFAAWFFFCYRSEIFRRPKVLAAVVLGIVLGLVFFARIYVGSVAEQRFDSAIAIVQGGASTEGSMIVRMQFYGEGLNMLLHSPVIGVGLDQFMFHSNSQHVAHSEYVEVFADTGIVGGMIYFSIFIVLWIRAGKIAKYTDDFTQFRIARLVRAILFVILISNFGRWNYYDKITWIIFASFIGYTSAVWNDIQARLEQQRFDPDALNPQ
jgi:O-antigen ligase